MEVSVRTTDGMVMQHGSGLGPLAGCVNYNLSDTTASAVASALAQPSGGVKLTNISGDPASGTVTALPFVPPTAPPPTQVAAGSGAGTGATVTLRQPDPSMSTDVRGIVDVTVGTTPAADGNGHYPLVTVTFGTPWPVAPLGAMIDRVGANAVALGLVFSDALSTGSFEIVAQNAPVAGQTYRISYALG